MCLAVRGEGYAMIYTPLGRTFDVQLDKIGAAELRAAWFDPRTGASQPFKRLAGKGRHTFDPPGEPGEGRDWVLVLDDVAREYSLNNLDPQEARP